MVLQKNKKLFVFGLITLLLFVAPFSLNGDFFVAHANFVIDGFNWLLTGIQKLFGWLVQAGISALSSAMDAGFVNAMMNSQAVTESWRAIRDLCNLGFILTLLFSAFATIFQVKQYHIKTLILNIVLVALLINFSFPIVRFIVDLGNVPMYYIAQQMLGGKTTGSIIAGESNVVCSLLPHYGKCSSQSALDYAENTATADILASIIMLFILGITLLVLAILLLIRTVALSILLIFSPLGFIGLAVPPLKKYANEYWDDLIKYTMFGPIMLLMIAISVKLMQTANASSGSSSMGNIAKFAVPIVILWYGMGMGQKMGVAGAGAVTGFAQKFAKGAGKRLSGYNMVKDFTKKRYDAYKSERKKRADELFKNNIGTKLGKKFNKGLYAVDEWRGNNQKKGAAALGGAIGLALGGPVGAAAGIAIGATFRHFRPTDEFSKRAQNFHTNERKEAIKKEMEKHQYTNIQTLTREGSGVTGINPLTGPTVDEQRRIDADKLKMDSTAHVEFNASGRIEFTGANADAKKKKFEEQRVALGGKAGAFVSKNWEEKRAEVDQILTDQRIDFEEMFKGIRGSNAEVSYRNLQNNAESIKNGHGPVLSEKEKKEHLDKVINLINARMGTIANAGPIS